VSVLEEIFGVKGGLIFLFNKRSQLIPLKNALDLSFSIPFSPDPSLLSGFLINKPL